MSLRSRVKELESRMSRKAYSYDSYEGWPYNYVEYKLENEVKTLKEEIAMLKKYLKVETHKPDCKKILRKRKKND